MAETDNVNAFLDSMDGDDAKKPAAQHLGE